MRFLMAGVASITSHASTKPSPFLRTMSCWVMTADRTLASWILTCCCWYGGNTSTIRSIDCAALLVCSVANTRCPVSAAVRAAPMVSKSRISPTRITSGSSRRTLRRALAKHVDAEARQSLDAIAEIVLHVLLEQHLLVLVHDGEHEFLHAFGREFL